MSDTEALDESESDVIARSYFRIRVGKDFCPEMVEELMTAYCKKLAQRKEDYRKVCHANSDLADIIQEKGQQVDDLRTELDEAMKVIERTRKFLSHVVTTSDDKIVIAKSIKALDEIDIWLSAHPEEK